MLSDFVDQKKRWKGSLMLFQLNGNVLRYVL